MSTGNIRPSLAMTGQLPKKAATGAASSVADITMILSCGPHGLLDAADHAEGQVAVEIPFVELVEDDRADRFEQWIVVQHSQQDPLRDEGDPRAGADLLVEPHLVADGCRRVPFPVRRRSGGPPRGPPSAAAAARGSDRRWRATGPAGREERASSFPRRAERRSRRSARNRARREFAAGPRQWEEVTGRSQASGKWTSERGTFESTARCSSSSEISSSCASRGETPKRFNVASAAR